MTQHAVLKKAVLKEQTENATMQAAMKEKEQEVRKSLQDLDLLTFHNQRLTKRIESLQTLATAKQGGSWLMGGGSVKKELEQSQATLEAVTIDLESKIEENEKLHQQLYEINALYPRHVTELKGKIQTLEDQNAELKLDVERAGVANEDTITMIRKEKQDMEKELDVIRNVLAGQLEDEKTANQSLLENIDRLEKDIERLSKVEAELDDLQKEHAKIKGELGTLTWVASEFTQLQESYSALERGKIQVEKAHAQLQQQMAALKQTEEQLRATLQREQEGSRTLNERNQRLLKDLEAVRGEAWSREQSQTNDIERLETELTKVLKEREELSKQFEELKTAEAIAKEGESQKKAELIKDLSGKESSLQATEAHVKELEALKEMLERDLKGTRASLAATKTELEEALKATERAPETTEIVSLELSKSESRKAETEKDTDKDPGEITGADEEGHVTDEDGSAKVPLSKKAKKKKKKAAADAAAAVTAAAVVVTSVVTKDNDTKESSRTITEIPNKSQDNSEAAAAAVKAGEERIRELELARKEVEESLRKEVETLRRQKEEAEKQIFSTADQLKAAQASLEAIKDEKASLSSSLEMHVDMTLQLQQEIEELKAEQEKRQRVHSNTNGAIRKASPAPSPTPAKGDHSPHRAATPVPTSIPTPVAATTTTAAVEAQTDAVSVQDESTQVEHVEAVDKGVQSNKVEVADESTQADLEAIKVSTDTAVDNPSTEKVATKSEKPSRRSVVVDDSGNLTAASSNQANREYLIKKHYETKIQNITEQLQVSDGQYARLHREFGMLKELLMETVDHKSQLQSQLDQLQRKNEDLAERLASAQEDNRQQADAMTNFMASLNDGR
ncbi:hypothetical protein BGZ83_008945 [Gryganskiella cystojenkinii]|nr:hypothetical protein BGZ83_008945 [Gryganskiella cystojenkinii]